MKTKLSFILASMLVFNQAAMAQLAAPQTFTVKAQVPLSSSVGITVNSVNSTGTAIFTPVSGTTLDFGTLTFNSTNQIYQPNHYFSIDVAPISGAGAPDTTITYTEGTNPNGTTNGLGMKTTATFDKEVYVNSTTNTETLLSEGKKRLIDLATPGLHVPYTEVSGGWLRVYVGVWVGSTASPADPSNGQPFSNADQAGTYTGTLLISATVN